MWLSSETMCDIKMSLEADPGPTYTSVMWKLEACVVCTKNDEPSVM